MSGGRPGGIGTRGGPRPRCVCPACGREVGTTEAGKVVYHNRPGRTFPECEGVGAVTAVPPRPAAPDICRCGLPRGTAVHGNPFGAGHAYDPRPSEAQRAYDEGRWCGECEYGVVADPPCCTQPAAPDATAGDGLRAVLVEQLRPAEPWPGAPSPERIIGTILALPALRDVLAAAARDAEKVRRVEELVDRVDRDDGVVFQPGWVRDVRRALDGTP